MKRWFCGGTSHADAVGSLRRADRGNDGGAVALDICRALDALRSTAAVVLRIIDTIVEAGKSDADAASTAGRPRSSGPWAWQKRPHA